MKFCIEAAMWVRRAHAIILFMAMIVAAHGQIDGINHVSLSILLFCTAFTTATGAYSIEIEKRR